MPETYSHDMRHTSLTLIVILGFSVKNFPYLVIINFVMFNSRGEMFTEMKTCGQWMYRYYNFSLAIT